MSENKGKTTNKNNEDLIYVGLIMKKDGWYKMFSDGNKHYTFEKFEKFEK